MASLTSSQVLLFFIFPRCVCLGGQILQLLQWRDRFWDVCCSLPADRQDVAVLSLHWQWMHKHLLLRLPPLLLGPAHSTTE